MWFVTLFVFIFSTLSVFGITLYFLYAQSACEPDSSYTFIPMFLKLFFICFLYSVKKCMWFWHFPNFIFLTFFFNLCVIFLQHNFISCHFSASQMAALCNTDLNVYSIQLNKGTVDITF